MKGLCIGRHRRCRSDGKAMASNGPRSSTSSSCSGSVTGDWMALEEQGDLCSGKRVIIVVDRTREARMALLWALSHVVHKLDVVTLLHFVPSAPNSNPSENQEILCRMKPPGKSRLYHEAKAFEITSSLKTLCSNRRPELEVEILIAEGAELGPTIVNQAKKLEASVVVLGQRKLGFWLRLFRLKQDGLVDYCIQNAECLTLAVRQKSKNLGGYLINSKWQRNFWLLA